MELGKLDRKLVIRTFWRGALFRLLAFVFWPWCLVMAATTGNWFVFPLLIAMTGIAVLVFRAPQLKAPQV